MMSTVTRAILSTYLKIYQLSFTLQGGKSIFLRRSCQKLRKFLNRERDRKCMGFFYQINFSAFSNISIGLNFNQSLITEIKNWWYFSIFELRSSRIVPSFVSALSCWEQPIRGTHFLHPLFESYWRFYKRVGKMTRFTASRCSQCAFHRILLILYTRALLKRWNLLRLRRIYLFSISAIYTTNKNVEEHFSICIYRFFFARYIIYGYRFNSREFPLSTSRR